MTTIKDYIDKNKILQKYINNKIEIGDRWSKGIDHHPKSEELMKHLCELDFAFNSDYFGFKMGGDGDNGETLMYLMDMFFELQDKENKPTQTITSPTYKTPEPYKMDKDLKNEY